MKKYLKFLGITCLFIVGMTLILTFLNYIGLIRGMVLTILKFLIPVLSLFIGSLFLGRNTEKKGWLSGIKFWALILIIFIILNLIFKGKFNIRTIIYYLILLVVSVLGSMVGISKNKREDLKN